MRLCAKNCKKSSFNQKKIERYLLYIYQKLEKYNTILAKEGGDKITK